MRELYGAIQRFNAAAAGLIERQTNGLVYLIAIMSILASLDLDDMRLFWCINKLCHSPKISFFCLLVDQIE